MASAPQLPQGSLTRRQATTLVTVFVAVSLGVGIFGAAYSQLRRGYPSPSASVCGSGLTGPPAQWFGSLPPIANATAAALLIATNASPWTPSATMILSAMRALPNALPVSNDTLAATNAIAAAWTSVAGGASGFPSGAAATPYSTTQTLPSVVAVATSLVAVPLGAAVTITDANAAELFGVMPASSFSPPSSLTALDALLSASWFARNNSSTVVSPRATQFTMSTTAAGALGGTTDSTMTPALYFAQFLRGLVQESAIQSYVHEYSSVPHIAGSVQNSQFLANATLQHYRSFGFDDVRLDTYPVLLADMVRRSVNVTSAVGSGNGGGNGSSSSSSTVLYQCVLDELDILNQTDWDRALMTSNAYSGNGIVEGPLVWANYGTADDFAVLAAAGVNLTGAIVAVRYGSIFRGNKADLAVSYGAVGVLIIVDPFDSGDANPAHMSPTGGGGVMPTGAWATNRTVQRGSVYDGNGDPLTPTWPSDFGGPVIQPSQTSDAKLMAGFPLPSIPIQPLGYGDARNIFQRALGGFAFPSNAPGWNTTGFFAALSAGGIGPSTSFAIRMEVARNLVVKNITNVVATMFGSVEPDRVVMLGCHRDAWTYGAVDPISGHSIVLETGRALGLLQTQYGWRPRRTIQLLSWDAEEWACTGSTEYVETYIELLRQRGVAYINLDTAVTGIDVLSFGASPSFATLIRDTLPQVALRNGSTTLTLANISDGRLSPIGSGSDYVSFVQLAAVPTLAPEMSSFDGRYEAMYHSNYDSAYWIEHFDDPGYHFHASMTELIARFMLRLSCDVVLPLNVVDFANHVSDWGNDIVGTLDTASTITMPNSTCNASVAPSANYFLQQTSRFVAAAAAFQSLVVQPTVWVVQQQQAATVAVGSSMRRAAANGTTANGSAPFVCLFASPFQALPLESNPLLPPPPCPVLLDPFSIRRLNDALMGLERVFLGYSSAETGQGWYKHVLFTPSAVDSYGATVMPLFADAAASWLAAAKKAGGCGSVEARAAAVNATFAAGRVAQFIQRAALFLEDVGTQPTTIATTTT